MSFKDWVDLVGKAIDGVGVAVIVVGILAATLWAALSSRRLDGGDLFRTYRRGIGKSILLGLEFLVAADIITTVAVSPSFRSAGVLAIIVMIRTFLSMALQLELDGRWPWQRPSAASQMTDPPPG